MNFSRQRRPARTNQKNSKNEIVVVGEDKERLVNDDTHLLLDEDEQDQMIHDIHQHYIQQSAQMESIFQTICCIVVPLLSLLFTILLQFNIPAATAASISGKQDGGQEGNFSSVVDNNNNNDKVRLQQILRWTHVTLNIVIHYFIPEIIRPQQRRHRYFYSTLNRRLAPEFLTSIFGSSNSSQQQPTATDDSFHCWRWIFIPYIVTLLVAAIATWMTRWQLRQVESIDNYSTDNNNYYYYSYYYHYSLCISTAVFIVSAFYLRNDHEQIRTSINDLQSSKYRYKAL